MSAETYRKVSEKLYQVEIDGKFVDIQVPFAKAEAVVSAFLSAGASIDEDGNVVTDPLFLIRSFSTVGNILLTKYDNKGKVLEEGACGDLAMSEVKALFDIASDVASVFMGMLSAQEKTAESIDLEKVKEKKTKN